MKLNRNNIQFYLIIFFVLNLIQVLFTPITDDEAYYWMYSHSLDWGFFDHPPMVGAIIKLGGFLFDGVLGVRLVTALLSAFSIYLLWNLIPKENREKPNSAMLFFLIALSIPIFNMYGFISTPDVPLLFFSALYLNVFYRFIANQNIVNTLLVGLVAALLMYSKYHGSLVILFTVLANLQILKRIYIYIAGAIGIALFFPHLNWQINHEFATFKYHLVQRSDNTLQFKNILEYFLNVLLVLNPILLIVFIAKWAKKEFATVNKTYKWLFIGVIIVFTITSLKGHVEPHWVAINSIPLLIMLHQLAMSNEKFGSLIKKITLISVGLILVVRIVIALPIIKIQGIRQNANEYFITIQKEAGDSKVAFVNSYQKTALYTFYTGEPAFSYNTYGYRKNQYDIWDYQDLYNGEDVYLIGNWPSHFFDSTYTSSGELILNKRVEKFPMVNKMEVTNVESSNKLTTDSPADIKFELVNPNSYDVFFDDPSMPYQITAAFINDELEKKFQVHLKDFPTSKANSSQIVEGKINLLDIPAGEYSTIFSIKPSYLYEVVISGTFKFEVLAK